MKTKKPLILLVSLAVILLVGVVGTLALLKTQSGPVENTFVPGNVSVTVHEEKFDATTKEGVYIKNTGNVDAYIRAAIIPTWEDGNGNPVGVSASLDDLTISWGSSDKWEKGEDGFWYYISPVSAGNGTDILIDAATVKTDSVGYNAGYQMNLQILAQGIQADGVDSNGKTPVEQVWSSGVSDVDSNGTLTIKQ